MNRIYFRYIVFLCLMIFSISLNIEKAYAFNFPPMPENKYVFDQALIFDDFTEKNIEVIYKEHEDKKNVIGHIYTTNDPVGDKSTYTKELKDWWDIGNNKNGIMIGIYPESKDNANIIVDENFENYISEKAIDNYENMIKQGLKDNTINEKITLIVSDLNNRLKDYTKKNTFLQTLTDTFFNFISNLGPEKKDGKDSIMAPILRILKF